MHAVVSATGLFTNMPACADRTFSFQKEKKIDYM